MARSVNFDNWSRPVLTESQPRVPPALTRTGNKLFDAFPNETDQRRDERVEVSEQQQSATQRLQSFAVYDGGSRPVRKQGRCCAQKWSFIDRWISQSQVDRGSQIGLRATAECSSDRSALRSVEGRKYVSVTFSRKTDDERDKGHWIVVVTHFRNSSRGKRATEMDIAMIASGERGVNGPSNGGKARSAAATSGTKKPSGNEAKIRDRDAQMEFIARRRVGKHCTRGDWNEESDCTKLSAETRVRNSSERPAMLRGAKTSVQQGKGWTKVLGTKIMDLDVQRVGVGLSVSGAGSRHLKKERLQLLKNQKARMNETRKR
ncbi:hypothetical protein FB451DRAFT_1165342 [Mycena latifolia]|nr:hypothetical protein FB451DRAFT_1165342 [Mycena latifolia]